MPVILLILLLVITFVIKKNIKVWKGRYYENLVYKKLLSLPDEYHIFNNLLFFHNGYSTQIDHVVVSQYGVFVIETKGYKGWIFGGEKTEYWTQVLYKKKYKFYNPIKQNEGHLMCLRDILKTSYEIPFIPIVVFNNSVSLGINTCNYFVIKRKHLNRTILHFRKPILEKQQVEWIIRTLHENYVEGTKEELENHISSVSQKANNEKEMIKHGICPKCGGTLILRHGRYGYFYGCSNYPKCKFTINR